MYFIKYNKKHCYYFLGLIQKYSLIHYIKSLSFYFWQGTRKLYISYLVDYTRFYFRITNEVNNTNHS